MYLYFRKVGLCVCSDCRWREGRKLQFRAGYLTFMSREGWLMLIAPGSGNAATIGMDARDNEGRADRGRADQQG